MSFGLKSMVSCMFLCAFIFALHADDTKIVLQNGFNNYEGCFDTYVYTKGGETDKEAHGADEKLLFAE